MQTTGFTVLNCGTMAILQRKRERREILLSAYELEFYTEDCEGGTITDGVFCPVRKQYYALYRPGQRQKLVAPYRCYFLNLVTHDPDLCDYLDHLPASGLIWDIDAVVALLREIIQLEDRNTPQGKLWRDSCVTRILSIIGRNRQVDQPMQSGAIRHREALMMVDRYIREHLDEDLSLERLGALSNLEPTYLQKLYVIAYGQSPAQRTLALRISAARIALIEENTPLSEIAARLGFSSQAHFSSTFKKVVGMAPARFRAGRLGKGGQ